MKYEINYSRPWHTNPKPNWVRRTMADLINHRLEQVAESVEGSYEKADRMQEELIAIVARLIEQANFDRDRLVAILGITGDPNIRIEGKKV